MWRAGHAEGEELQKWGDGGAGFMQMDANEGAETVRLGMPLHSPLREGYGRLMAALSPRRVCEAPLG